MTVLGSRLFGVLLLGEVRLKGAGAKDNPGPET